MPVAPNPVRPASGSRPETIGRTADTDGGTRHVSRLIARPRREVYEYAADPRNLVHRATASVNPGRRRLVARVVPVRRGGRRLRPPTTTTEIGRTAAAFDEMLDALDVAQQAPAASARDALDAVAQARAAEREARRSEATARRFLSDAAHELRTPPAGMQTLAESLVRDSDDDRETREELAIALVRETSWASSLVTDMLDLARIEGGFEGGGDLERRPVDLTAPAIDQVDRLRLLDPELDATVDAPGLVVVTGDEQQLRRVLVNLLDNAPAPAARRRGADQVRFALVSRNPRYRAD